MNVETLQPHGPQVHKTRDAIVHALAELLLDALDDEQDHEPAERPA